MSVLDDIKNSMSPKELEEARSEYLEETAFLRTATDSLKESIVHEIERVLDEEHISQNELMRRMGFSSRTMTQLMNCKGNPTLATIAQLARITGRTPRIVWDERPADRLNPSDS